MQELITLLESEIRRIVKEELRYATQTTDADFKLKVRDACIDQQWFDDAVSSEVDNYSLRDKIYDAISNLHFEVKVR